ncbi:MAG: serine hydroxymethyltransferase [Sedimentisphaerales bacterium]|nr:serine hydroxymethyltransferase [Sedimentisphaerales bacterium]MBN2842265.1 serine hydroxymethyltransferase [Sedimentisphaerales bacterium]
MSDNVEFLSQSDPEIFKLIEKEHNRQQNTLEMIASENHTSKAVMAAAGSCLTNKYAEGYPQKRYYGGCECVDEVEQLAIDRAKALFGCDHANVQPHSGSQANMAAYFAAIEPGDTILAMDLAHGGHLTHGFKINFSGKLYNVLSYGVKQDTETIDYDQLAKLAAEHKPKMVVCGASAYPRIIDFEKIAEIAHANGAVVMADIAHIAGLVCTGLHPSPVKSCEFVTTTTHKTLRGPRSGMTMCKEEYAKKVNSAVFPGLQGGPLCHIIAAKAVAFGEALQPAYKQYMQQVVQNCKVLSQELVARGFRLCSGGSDNHLLLLDLRPYNADLTGAAAEKLLQAAGIITNKNLIPFDTRKATEASGIRIGTPALTTRGLKDAEMKTMAALIDAALKSQGDEAKLAKVRSQVAEMCQNFPID